MIFVNIKNVLKHGINVSVQQTQKIKKKFDFRIQDLIQESTDQNQLVLGPINFYDRTKTTSPRIPDLIIWFQKNGLNFLLVLIKIGYRVIFVTAIIVLCFIKRYFFIFTDDIVPGITGIYTVCSMHQAFNIWNHSPTSHQAELKSVTNPISHFKVHFWMHFDMHCMTLVSSVYDLWYNNTFILNETYHAPNGSLSKVGVGGKSKFVILNPLNGFGWKSRLWQILIEHWSFIWVKMIISTSSWNQDGRRVQRNLGLKVFAIFTKNNRKCTTVSWPSRWPSSWTSRLNF